MNEVAELDKNTLLQYEKDVTGFYISGHPFDKYQVMFEKQLTPSLDFIVEEDATESTLEQDQDVVIGGLIADMRKVYTKKGSQMAIFSVEDTFGKIKVVCFPKQYEICFSMLEEGAPVIIKGHVSIDDETNEPEVLLDDITPIQDAAFNAYVKYDTKDEYHECEAELTELLETLGESRMTIYLADIKQRKTVKSVNNYAIFKLYDKYGPERVVVKIA